MNPSYLPSTFFDHAEALRELRGRERARVRKELEGLYQVSGGTLTRWLQTAGVECRTRSDKGKHVNGVTVEHMETVFTLQYSSYKKTQGPIMPAEDAIEIAEHNLAIPAGILTPSAYNAWLRARGTARSEVDIPEPHVDLISLGPNHVHQADFSLAINWKIKNNQAVYDDLVYKNKLPAAGEPRLLRMVVTDHTTGSFFVWYFAAAGESVPALIEGLWLAWTEKKCQGESIQRVYPFRGVPRILMLDRGPGNKSQILRNFLDHLGVKLNICEGARSKGQVESAQWWWEQGFESRFRLDPVVDIARLNDDAVGFAAKWNKERVHGRTGATRTAHWEFHINRSFESQLRVPNCSFEEAKHLATSPEKECRVNGSGVIEFRSNKYRVPAILLGQHKVTVWYSPFEFPSVNVKSLEDRDAVPFLCEPIQFNEHGFPADGVVIGAEFKSHKQTERGKAISQAEQDLRLMGVKVGSPKYIKVNATGEEAQRIVTRGYHLEGLEGSGIKSRETALDVQPAEASVYTLIHAREEVIRRVARNLEPAEKRVFRAFGETVTEEEIQDAVAQIQAGITAEVLSFASAQR